MEKDTHLMLGIAIWFIIVIMALALLSGCSRQTPVSEINNEIQHEVTELVDYANNNMVMDSDKQLLLNGARHCAARANDLVKTCDQTIYAYRKETAGWKLATTLITIIAALLGVAWIKK